MSPKNPDSETSVRLTAFNISSMHKKIVIALRLMNTPTAPMENSSADSPRYQDNGTMMNCEFANSGSRIEDSEIRNPKPANPSIPNLLHVAPTPSLQRSPSISTPM